MLRIEPRHIVAALLLFDFFHHHSLVRTFNGNPMSFVTSEPMVGFIITAWDCGSKGNFEEMRECSNAGMCEWMSEARPPLSLAAHRDGSPYLLRIR
jgi:hypothetical protein